MYGAFTVTHVHVESPAALRDRLMRRLCWALRRKDVERAERLERLLYDLGHPPVLQ